MNAQPVNVFLLASRLRNISMTEIVLAALGIAGHVYNATNASISGWAIFHMVVAALLLGTGILGVLAIHRLRNNTAGSFSHVSSFRALGACNVVLCIIDSITLILLAVICIMLLFWEKAAHRILGLTNYPKEDNDPDAESRRHHTEGALGLPGPGTAILLVYAILLAITGFYVALTAMAAVFSFRISAGLSATGGQVPMVIIHAGNAMIPPAGVPLLGAPGYGAYPMAPMQPPPVYPSDVPLKQNLGY